MSSLHLKISGMQCHNCQATVERALKAVPGTYGVDVDVQAGAAEVSFDGKTNPQKFVEAIQAAGYAAEVAA
jgi:copper chaperone CopZ